MSTDNRELVEQLLKAFEAKDLDAALACFADDALLFDPHYPTPEMHGKAAIRQGFEFIFGIVKQPGFTVRHFSTYQRPLPSGEGRAAACAWGRRGIPLAADGRKPAYGRPVRVGSLRQFMASLEEETGEVLIRSGP